MLPRRARREREARADPRRRHAIAVVLLYGGGRVRERAHQRCDARAHRGAVPPPHKLQRRCVAHWGAVTPPHKLQRCYGYDAHRGTITPPHKL